MKFFFLLLALAATAGAANVRIEAVPENGVQPEVAVDAAGNTHLVYLKGDPKACDVRYVRRAKGAREWSSPVSVNSEAKTAVAMGTIRGAQLALGKGGSVHVVWNGTAKAGAGMPLFYARLESMGGKFAPQRNLLGETSALDGGASVAADEKGEVFVVWHGKKDTTGDETLRVVFVLKSTDNGATFSATQVANADYAGVCPCCSLKALAAPDGGLFTLYRAARNKSQRDITLLSSADGATSYQHETVHPWSVSMCPMSSAAMLQTAKGVRAAWETDGKIYSALVGPGATKGAPAEFSEGKAKHPALAVNSRGETLVAWAVGTGWGRGGELGWTILDAAGQPTAQRGKGNGVPVWGLVAAYADANGDFVILR